MPTHSHVAVPSDARSGSPRLIVSGLDRLTAPFVRAVIVLGVAAVTIAELGLLATAVGGDWPLEELFLLHALVALSLIPLSVLAWISGIRAASFYLFVMSVAIAGPLGVIGVAAMCILQRFHARRSVPFERWHAEFFAEPGRDRIEELDDRLARSGSASFGNGTVASFADVMNAGTIAQKQSVLGLIADHFDPVYASVLRGALNDPEPVIRVQAASVAARLEDDFQKQGAGLRQCLERDPDSQDGRAALARYYRAASRAGLADDFATAALRREALERLAGLAARFPQDREILAARAELMLDDGRPDAAIALLHPLAQQGDPDPDLVGTYLAALFGARRFEEIRHLAGRIGALPGSSAIIEELQPVLDLWGARHAPNGALR